MNKALSDKFGNRLAMFGSSVGDGGFGTVKKFAVDCQNPGTDIAIKYVSGNNPQKAPLDLFAQEIRWMKKFNGNPHFAKLYFDISHKDTWKNFHVIGSEFHHGGDLLAAMTAKS